MPLPNPLDLDSTRNPEQERLGFPPRRPPDPLDDQSTRRMAFISDAAGGRWITPPEPRGERKEEREYASKEEVAQAINALSAALFSTFSRRDEVMRQVSSLYSLVANHTTEDRVRTLARLAVPMTLRDMDDGSSSRPGSPAVLMLAPGGASGVDRAFWGEYPRAPAAVESDWAFGVYELQQGISTGYPNARALFYGGPALKGTNAPVWGNDETLDITAQGQIAYVSFSLAGGGTIGWGVANSDNFPISSSNNYVVALQSFNWTTETINGIEYRTITKLRTYHRGALKIDSAYA